MDNILFVLEELEDDNTVPKNVRSKIAEIKMILAMDAEMEIKKSKVMYQLEVISEDVNLQPYTRTQIWDIISGLENVQ